MEQVIEFLKDWGWFVALVLVIILSRVFYGTLVKLYNKIFKK